MAFMVPVLQNDWDLYGTGSGNNSRRSSKQTRSAPQSRRSSQAIGGLSRQTSASSSGSAATTPGFSMHGPCFSSSRCPQGSSRSKMSRAASSTSGDSNSAQRCVTFGPPSPPCASKAGGRQAEKHNFHTKVVDKLMRVLHRGEKEGARRS